MCFVLRYLCSVDHVQVATFHNTDLEENMLISSELVMPHTARTSKSEHYIIMHAFYARQARSHSTVHITEPTQVGHRILSSADLTGFTSSVEHFSIDQDSAHSDQCMYSAVCSAVCEQRKQNYRKPVLTASGQPNGSNAAASAPGLLCSCTW